MLMEVAQVVAKRGTCDRKQVGAVIARDGRIIAIGYNGAPPGLPHCDENGHGWILKTATEMQLLADELNLVIGDEISPAAVARWGCRNATHAEANALAFAARYGVSTDEAQLFVTVSPCEVCSRLLIAAGISSVSYLEAYRDNAGLELLLEAGIIPILWA